MIRQLDISNYALISDISISPAEGLNIITGETGSGKSIIMGALALLRGGRADAKTLGSRDKKSVVKAVFDISPEIASSLTEVCASFSIPVEPGGAITLTREISPGGRSKATANGVAVSLAALEQLSALLVDIHSQHQNSLLSEADFQLRTIDDIADNDALLADYRKTYSDYRLALKKFADTREEIARTASDADYLEFQLREFDSLDLKENEEAELSAERDALILGAELSKQLSAAATALTWNDTSATDLVGNALSALRAISESDARYASLAARLETVAAELADIADTVDADASLRRDDSAALEEVETRLQRIHALMSKHRADSFDALMAIRDSLRQRLDRLAGSDALLRRLENEARSLKRTAMEKASLISARRKEAAAKLAGLLAERARPLGMPNLAVEIPVTTGKLNPDGIDTVEFLFAFNKNQTPAPVARHASGGEISRLMLALKSITAAHRRLPTIIFDEIDTGVSGEVARRMGLLMDGIAGFMQVFTITHLPQVASLGQAHFKVFKLDEADATHTHIRRLERADRRTEIAQMLAGEEAGEEAFAAADSLLGGV